MKASQDSKDKAPKFGSELKDLELEEEMEAKFKCKVKGEPMPDVTWYVNDTEVTSSEGIYVVTYEEGKCSLTIKSVTADMNGNVTCKVHYELRHGLIGICRKINCAMDCKDCCAVKLERKTVAVDLL